MAMTTLVIMGGHKLLRQLQVNPLGGQPRNVKIHASNVSKQVSLLPRVKAAIASHV